MDTLRPGGALVFVLPSLWLVGLFIGGQRHCFWLLQHTSRLLLSLQRAADQPMGTVLNAVMFHAQLHNGLRLLQVLSLAGSLGRLDSPQGQQPEVFVWRDEAGDEVQCSFQEGRLMDWVLSRHAEEEDKVAGA